MGLYINQTDRTKEQWLSDHATRISDDQAKNFNYDDQTTPICLPVTDVISDHTDNETVAKLLMGALELSNELT